MRPAALTSASLAAALVALGLSGVARADVVQIGLATAPGPANITDASSLNGTSSLGSGSYIAGNGYASYVGSFGSTVSLTISNGVGTPPNPEPQLTGSVTASFAAGATPSNPETLYVYISELGLTYAEPGAFTLSSAFSLSSGTNTSVTESTYIDPNNNPYALTDLLASSAFSSSGGTGNGAPMLSSTPALTAPYSLTELFVISVTGDTDPGGTILTSRANLTTAPEPGSLALLATGLLGLGLIRRRRT